MGTEIFDNDEYENDDNNNEDDYKNNIVNMK